MTHLHFEESVPSSWVEGVFFHTIISYISDLTHTHTHTLACTNHTARLKWWLPTCYLLTCFFQIQDTGHVSTTNSLFYIKQFLVLGAGDSVCPVWIIHTLTHLRQTPQRPKPLNGNVIDTLPSGCVFFFFFYTFASFSPTFLWHFSLHFTSSSLTACETFSSCEICNFCFCISCQRKNT